jgi:hypothetical protein
MNSREWNESVQGTKWIQENEMSQSKERNEFKRMKWVSPRNEMNSREWNESVQGTKWIQENEMNQSERNELYKWIYESKGTKWIQGNETNPNCMSLEMSQSKERNEFKRTKWIYESKGTKRINEMNLWTQGNKVNEMDQWVQENKMNSREQINEMSQSKGTNPNCMSLESMKWIPTVWVLKWTNLWNES